MGVSNEGEMKTGFICGQGTTQVEQNIFVLEDNKKKAYIRTLV